MNECSFTENGNVPALPAPVKINLAKNSPFTKNFRFFHSKNPFSHPFVKKEPVRSIRLVKSSVFPGHYPCAARNFRLFT